MSHFIATSDKKEFEQFLRQQSNLPGRRANIELARAFASLIEEDTTYQHEQLFDWCAQVCQLSTTDAQENTPYEILPFCGTVGLGAFGLLENYQSEVLDLLELTAQNRRWRTREATVFALQNLLIQHTDVVIDQLFQWLSITNWLVFRAIAAGIAHPNILHDKDVASKALKLHSTMFQRILKTPQEERTGDFMVFRKGLAYTLSVVVAALPSDGFNYLKDLVTSEIGRDKDVLWIIRENLKKNRLTKSYPDKVQDLKQAMEN